MIYFRCVFCRFCRFESKNENYYYNGFSWLWRPQDILTFVVFQDMLCRKSWPDKATFIFLFWKDCYPPLGLLYDSTAAEPFPWKKDTSLVLYTIFYDDVFSLFLPRDAL